MLKLKSSYDCKISELKYDTAKIQQFFIITGEQRELEKIRDYIKKNYKPKIECHFVKNHEKRRKDAQRKLIAVK